MDAGDWDGGPLGTSCQLWLQEGDITTNRVQQGLCIPGSYFNRKLGGLSALMGSASGEVAAGLLLWIGWPSHWHRFIGDRTVP